MHGVSDASTLSICFYALERFSAFLNRKKLFTITTELFEYKHKTVAINIVLNVEAINSSAENALQRKKRISFYSRNGIYDTGCKFVDGDETYSVLASDTDHFDSKEYEMLLSGFSFGTYKKHIT